jgi:lipoate-protein ligase A
VVISCGIWVDRPYQNDRYFKLINQSVINCIAKINPIFASLEQSGISDISYMNRKCAGTSMFRSRNYLLYQASILVETDLLSISKYLAHPSREPDYRKGRSHSNFLVSLSEIDPQLSVPRLNAGLRAGFVLELHKMLGGELIACREDQAEYIKKKALEDPENE